ncbi:voltage-gated chloride channel family protein [Paenibacillus beijingensis]|uniref:Voltage-gated chloride channel protein n=1 Tax=Paenibacillus beijingensis TaxID=1126833 RepID=A0A0D5NGT0_9BACL|nr:voltage-gated chloride channel family protein [Paenibacillus beijingensis]AJY74486.1 voltage-gated chloride channel protein [Paenibacillus beijingensis]
MKDGGKPVYVTLPAAFVKWIVLGGAVGLLAGSASALFLAGLDWATGARVNHPWLLYLLPIAGAAVSWLYAKFGGNSGKGNNLILEQIHDGGETIPLRMAPFTLAGTIATHLFGGSAGREGTAVQMGGALSDGLARLIRADAYDRRLLLMCGVSGGFGAVFGTPLAGAVFGLEVAAIGILRYEALIPCLSAGLIGDWTTRAWGIGHSAYSIGAVPALSAAVIAKVAAASILFGLTSRLFSELTHALKRAYAAAVPNPALRGFAGGVLIIGLVALLGTRDYIGLSLPLLEEAFRQAADPLAFLWKTIATSLTLGAGFQGGEVTPLFVIGATLGSALAPLLQLSVPFMAALGLIGVFCGAANTPIACFILGLELFGAEGAIPLFIVCSVSYLFSGHSGIYTSQRIASGKYRAFGQHEGLTGLTLAQIRRKKRE